MLNIILHNRQLLVEMTQKQVKLPSINSLTALKPHLIEIYVSSTQYVATLADPLAITVNNLTLIGLRQALIHFDSAIVEQIIYYQQLTHYYATHKFCGSCGNLTKRQLHNKFVLCDQCNSEIYPHIAPCIIVRIHKNKEILMARGVNFPPKAWGLIAGFVEIGESLEQAVVREVQEEVGISIKNINYWASQAWPFPSNSLMVGFTAEYKSGEIILDCNEIEEAGFYTCNNLPGMPSLPYSISSKMINQFLQDND